MSATAAVLCVVTAGAAGTRCLSPDIQRGLFAHDKDPRLCLFKREHRTRAWSNRLDPDGI